MDTTALLALAELLAGMVKDGMSAYTKLHAANTGVIPPLETILAQDDIDWGVINAKAKAQVAAEEPPVSGV